MGFKIEAVMFDAGGVLHTHSQAAIIRNIGLTLDITDDNVSKAFNYLTPQLGRGEMSEDEHDRLFLQLTGSARTLPGKPLLLPGYARTFRTNTEVMTIVKRIRTSGLKTAVLSNTVPSHAEYNRIIGIYDVDQQFLSYEMKLRKPDPRIYLEALERLAVKAESAIFIDDDVKNTAAAHDLGINSYCFRNAAGLNRYLQSFGVLR